MPNGYGNNTGNPNDRGLTRPAAWEAKIEPEESQCKKLLGEDFFVDLQTSFKKVMSKKFSRDDDYPLFRQPDEDSPLDGAMISVGAVNYKGDPIVMTRLACPKAVALGFGGVGGDPDNLPPFLTGTSVSATGAVSLLAAEAVRQGSSMATSSMSIDASSMSAATLFESLAGKSVPRYRYQSSASCREEESIDCGPLPWLGKPIKTYTGQNFTLKQPVKGAIFGKTYEAHHEYRLHPAPVCIERIPHCIVDRKNDECRFDPTPEVPICTSCELVFDQSTTASYPQLDSRTASLWIEPNLAAGKITSAALIIETEYGKPVLTTELSVGELTQSNMTKIDVPESTVFMNPRAWLSAHMEDGSVLSQEIFVLE